MNSEICIYPIRWCTGGCAKGRHDSHLYQIDPVDGDLSSPHLCPGNSGQPVMECMEDGETTGNGYLAKGDWSEGQVLPASNGPEEQKD